MDAEVFLAYTTVVVLAGLVTLLCGAGIAKLLGYDLNEPEYYEAKKDRNNVR